MDYKELIETLRGHKFNRDSDLDCTPFECGAFHLCEEAADALETLLAEREADGWVSVEDDRKPGIYQDCLCYVVIPASGGQYICGYRVLNHCGSGEWSCEGMIVTHWKPLPAPPENEGR